MGVLDEVAGAATLDERLVLRRPVAVRLLRRGRLGRLLGGWGGCSGRHSGGDPLSDFVAWAGGCDFGGVTVTDDGTASTDRSGFADQPLDGGFRFVGERGTGSAVELDGQVGLVGAAGAVRGGPVVEAASLVDGSVDADEEVVGHVRVFAGLVVVLVLADAVVAEAVVVRSDGDSGPVDDPSGGLSVGPGGEGSFGGLGAPSGTVDDGGHSGVLCDGWCREAASRSVSSLLRFVLFRRWFRQCVVLTHPAY